MTHRPFEAALVGIFVGGFVGMLLLASGCETWDPTDGYGIVGPFDTTGSSLSADGRGAAGPKDKHYSDTEVWSVENAWMDTDTPAAKQAGLAWRENSGLNWEQKYSLWVDALRPADSVSSFGTYEIETPTGKVLPAPSIECAETAYFLRALFASWYHLPFYVEAVDGDGNRIFLGHFGFRTKTGRYANTPKFATKYTDYSHLTAEQVAGNDWPSDPTLRAREIYGNASDDQPAIGEDAHFGTYLDELLLNKRVGYFMLILLPYFGSVNLADDAIAWHVQADAIAPGAFLLERWQKRGIGHTLVLKEVQWLEGDEVAAELISGSMPRRQGKWESSTASKMYFTNPYTGGEGSNSDGDDYVNLGGGAKRFLSATSESGYWRNNVPADGRDDWIPTSDKEARAARPELFEELLAEVDGEQMIEELVAVIDDRREHLRDHPSSCSARIAREDYFDQLYDVLLRERGWDCHEADQEYRLLEDYVFAELEYDKSRTCCWNSTTREMYTIVMDYNQELTESDPDTCVEPEVFKVRDDGYDRFEDYAHATGRGDQWVPWSADESCPQANVTDDTESAHGWTDYCDLDIAGVGGEEPGEGDDDYEPNEDEDEAIVLGEGAYSGLEIESASDEDWFRIYAGGDHVTVTIDFDHGTGDLDLELLDLNGFGLDSSTSTDDSEQVSGSGSTVLVRVYGYAGATGSYDLAVTID